MRISTLGYIGKQGVKNIGRNKNVLYRIYCDNVSLYFSVRTVLFYRAESAAFVKTAEEGVAITVFLMRMQQKVRSRRLARSFAAGMMF